MSKEEHKCLCQKKLPCYYCDGRDTVSYDCHRDVIHCSQCKRSFVFLSNIVCWACNFSEYACSKCKEGVCSNHRHVMDQYSVYCDLCYEEKTGEVLYDRLINFLLHEGKLPFEQIKRKFFVLYNDEEITKELNKLMEIGLVYETEDKRYYMTPETKKIIKEKKK